MARTLTPSPGSMLLPQNTLIQISFSMILNECTVSHFNSLDNMPLLNNLFKSKNGDYTYHQKVQHLVIQPMKTPHYFTKLEN